MDLSTLARIERRVPGFRGYSDSEQRRASDRTLRVFATDQLERLLSGLEVAVKELDAEDQSSLGAVCSVLDGFRDGLAAGTERFTGFFSDRVFNRVDVLDPVYEQDERIVETLVVLRVAVDDGNFTVPHLEREVRALERAFEGRTAAIRSLEKSAALLA